MSGIGLTRGALFATATGLSLTLPQACAGTDAPTTFPQDAALTMEGRGAGLYTRYCAACHGKNGSGEQAVSGLFYPRIRAFSSGEFHIVSTDNGVPTDEDLIAVMRNGERGEAMQVGGIDSLRHAVDRGQAILALPSWSEGELR